MADEKGGREFDFIEIGDPPAGKNKSGGRTVFQPEQFDTVGLLSKMPVEEFLVIMNKEHNVAVFMIERDVGRVTTNSKRRPIWSLMRFVELIYPDIASTCSTDSQCLQHLVGSHYVTIYNFIPVLRQLQALLTTLHRPFVLDGVQVDKSGAFATVIGDFRKVFKKKPFWGDGAIDVEVKKVFGIVPEHGAKLRVVKNKRLERNLKNVQRIKFSAFKEFIMTIDAQRKAAERSLIEDEDLTDAVIFKLKRTIIICICCIVQSMASRRIIEVLRVSTFIASKKDGYIDIIGLAKKRARVRDGDDDDDGEDDDGAIVDRNARITIPLNMLDWAGTDFSRDFLIAQVARARELMVELWPDIATQTNTQVTNHFVGPCIGKESFHLGELLGVRCTIRQ